MFSEAGAGSDFLKKCRSRSRPKSGQLRNPGNIKYAYISQFFFAKISISVDYCTTSVHIIQ